MVWFFERHGTYIRCETRDVVEGGYELLLINPDGSGNWTHTSRMMGGLDRSAAPSSVFRTPATIGFANPMVSVAQG